LVAVELLLVEGRKWLWCFRGVTSGFLYLCPSDPLELQSHGTCFNVCPLQDVATHTAVFAPHQSTRFRYRCCAAINL